MNKDDLMKLKGQNTVNKIKRQLTELEEIFVNYISDKRLISIIPKELKKDNTPKNKQPNVTDLTKGLPKEDI